MIKKLKLCKTDEATPSHQDIDDWVIKDLSAKPVRSTTLHTTRRELEAFGDCAQDYDLEVVPYEFMGNRFFRTPWLKDSRALDSHDESNDVLDNISRVSLSVADYLTLARLSDQTERPAVLSNLARLSSYVIDSSEHIWLVSIKPDLVANSYENRQKLAAKVGQFAQKLLSSHNPNHATALRKVSAVR